ncbi:MAG TPA: class II aldolase/adducin family protein [Nocardioides sp.]|uniref:class II aldolase/adducin family protein n=1 Tax=Nocardioides sp. TaxID=35761 RepID=UPI002E30AEA4|nr:class II aldolase/adducin family protein [Nocardioides sp.]HEX3931792.1 class II aldolase/adducin family protein [Nocardioides sp.]
MTRRASAAEQICRYAASVHRRGLTHGRTGNISVRLDQDRLLVTPTGSSLGDLTPDRLAVVDLAGRHLEGAAPSKEAFLHAALLRSRPHDNAVVHLHSHYAVAVSCLTGLRAEDPLPVLTPYYAMRVPRLVVLDYHAPGDRSLEPLAESLARETAALLIRQHGAVVAGRDLDTAADAIEELEATARLFLEVRALPHLELEASEAIRLRKGTSL